MKNWTAKIHKRHDSNIETVIPTLNVSRKFSMCIIFSTGYIKIYNINSSNECFIQKHVFVQSTIQYYTSKVYKIHP